MPRISTLTLVIALATAGTAFAGQDHDTRDASAPGATATLHRLGAELKGALHKLGDATRHALHRADVAAHRASPRDDERRHS